MPDLLNTSLTGMLAFQRALEVTSHNISNANTPGYTRQIAEFSSRIGTGDSSGYIGGGVQVSTVKRVFDALQTEQLRNSTTGYMRFSALNELAGRVDTLLADSDTGLNAGMQRFFNSLQDVSNNPASIPTRQALLGEATGIAARFQSLDRRLGEIESEVNGRLELAVDDVNRLARNIADINEQISLAQSVGQPPNDLLDQRDRLVLALSEQVAVTTTVQDDGAMNVFIGSGQSLVVGGNVQLLGVQGSEFDPTRLEVVYQGDAGATRLDTSLSGGNLGGLLEFRAVILDPARQALGQTAVAFASSLNAQNRDGMDLRGDLGSDIFSIASPTILYSGNNTGSGTATAAFGDLGQLTGADYVLEYDGASYTLTRADTNEVIPMTGSGTPANPFVAAGMTISVGGAPAAGDVLMIRSGRDIAASIENVMSDPQQLAFAAPTRSSASPANLGDAQISAAWVADVTVPSLLNTSVIEFTSPTTFSVNGAGSYTYTDGARTGINGSAVIITGNPAVGDRFIVEANYGATGDNSNGLLMTDIQGRQILDGGTVSINENYGQLVSAVGSATRQVQANLDAADVVRTNAEEAVLATSGVNLDEEAARLIRYQQSYQAVAQVVAVASTLFDSLLAATRR
ncbi:MAG: flagellar hook-associated protein FlgK [Woeseiaceae bacterium]|nr:flagellar hook-associated protein FlgK [Woeseiaceae bacterium]